MKPRFANADRAGPSTEGKSELPRREEENLSRQGGSALQRAFAGGVGILCRFARLSLLLLAVLSLFFLLWRGEDPLREGRGGLEEAASEDLRTLAADLACMEVENSPFDFFFSWADQGTPPGAVGVRTLVEFSSTDLTVYLDREPALLLRSAFACLPKEDAPLSFAYLEDAILSENAAFLWEDTGDLRLAVFRVPYTTVNGEERLFSMLFDRYTIYQLLLERPEAARGEDEAGESELLAKRLLDAEVAASADLARLQSLFKGERAQTLYGEYQEVLKGGGLQESSLFAPLYLPGDDPISDLPFLFTVSMKQGTPRFRIYRGFLLLTLSTNGDRFALLIDPESRSLCALSRVE